MLWPLLIDDRADNFHREISVQSFSPSTTKRPEGSVKQGDVKDRGCCCKVIVICAQKCQIKLNGIVSLRSRFEGLLRFCLFPPSSIYSRRQSVGRDEGKVCFVLLWLLSGLGKKNMKGKCSLVINCITHPEGD